MNEINSTQGKSIDLNGYYKTDNSIINYHFPNASHSFIKKSGHWIHAENPEDFFRVTLAWLKKTSFL